MTPRTPASDFDASSPRPVISSIDSVMANAVGSNMILFSPTFRGDANPPRLIALSTESVITTAIGGESVASTAGNVLRSSLQPQLLASEDLFLSQPTPYQLPPGHNHNLYSEPGFDRMEIDFPSRVGASPAAIQEVPFWETPASPPQRRFVEAVPNRHPQIQQEPDTSAIVFKTPPLLSAPSIERVVSSEDRPGPIVSRNLVGVEGNAMQTLLRSARQMLEDITDDGKSTF